MGFEGCLKEENSRYLDHCCFDFDLFSYSVSCEFPNFMEVQYYYNTYELGQYWKNKLILKEKDKEKKQR